MAKMKDIAELSGVSRATVSYVLNRKIRKNPISNVTREKVLAAAEKLSYFHDDMARAVASGKSNTIAYVTYSTAGSTTMAVCNEALEHSYNVRLLDLQNFMDNFEQLISKSRLAGVIINHSYSDELTLRLSKKSIPYVVLNSRTSDPQAMQVHSNEEKATQLIANHLIDSGRQKICFCCYSLDDYKMNLRFELFNKLIQSYRLKGQLLLFNNTPECRSKLAATIEDPKMRPDAFIAANEGAVFSLHSMILSSNLKIPRDISLVSYSDSSRFNFLIPAVSAVNENRQAIGAQGVKMLIDAIKGNQIDQKNQTIDVELIVRESSDIKRKVKL